MKPKFSPPKEMMQNIIFPPLNPNLSDRVVLHGLALVYLHVY